MAFGQRSGHQLYRIKAVDADVVLIVRVEVGDMVRATDLANIRMMIPKKRLSSGMFQFYDHSGEQLQTLDQFIGAGLHAYLKVLSMRRGSWGEKPRADGERLCA